MDNLNTANMGVLSAIVKMYSEWMHPYISSHTPHVLT